VTIAICTFCGTEKIGAFVPCKRCGSTPKTVEEGAKSITLTDHNFPPVELQRFSQMIRTGVAVPYDPIGLAVSADKVISREYYWRHRKAEGNQLPCMRCGSRFSTDVEAVLCPACTGAVRQPVSFCPRCVSVCGMESRQCPQCGGAISASGHSSARSVAIALMLGMERLTNPEGPCKISEAVTRANAGLLPARQARCQEEIRWLAIYVTVTMLRENAHSASSAGMTIVREIVELYRKSLAFRGIESKLAAQWADECTARFEEYDFIVADFVRDGEHDPKKWFHALAATAEKYCFPTIGQGAAFSELVRLISYFIKAQRHLLGLTLSGGTNPGRATIFN